MKNKRLGYLTGCIIGLIFQLFFYLTGYAMPLDGGICEICGSVHENHKKSNVNEDYESVLDSTLEKFRNEKEKTRFMVDDFWGTDEDANAFAEYIYQSYDYTSQIKVYKTTKDGEQFNVLLESENPKTTYEMQKMVECRFLKKTQEIQTKSPRQQVEAIHDWLAGTVQYDFTFQNNTVYSAVMMGSSACNGYGRSFQVMCNLAGIECESIRGVANGQSHIWNRVKINGEWSYLDVTWNSQSSSKRWFLVPKAVMDQTHFQTMDIILD